MYKRTFNPCDECTYGIDRRDGSGNDSMCKICEFSELLNRRAQPENEPLTLSELYDIDSEPLYFHCMVGHWSLNGWHIVKAINYDGAQFKDVQLDNNDAHIESLYNYGITWLAYRYKPERSEG